MIELGEEVDKLASFFRIFRIFLADPFQKYLRKEGIIYRYLTALAPSAHDEG